MQFNKERGLMEKVTSEQRLEGGREGGREAALGILGEVLQAEGTARAKSLREEQQETSAAGVQQASS